MIIIEFTLGDIYKFCEILPQKTSIVTKFTIMTTIAGKSDIWN